MSPGYPFLRALFPVAAITVTTLTKVFCIVVFLLVYVIAATALSTGLCSALLVPYRFLASFISPVLIIGIVVLFRHNKSFYGWRLESKNGANRSSSMHEKYI
jgi:hypothetical protein